MTEAETRQHIIFAALKLLAEKGFTNLNMNDIVRESGVSKGGVYWHFKSKDEIVQAMLDFILTEQINIVNVALSEPDSASAKLRRIARFAEAEALEQMPSPLDLYALATRDPVLMGRLIAYFDQYQARIAVLVQQGIDEGEFTPGDPSLIALNIISLIEGAFLIGLTIPNLDFAAQVESAIDLLLQGLNRRT